eukprot:scaffold768_cov382-Prasinococcus_capsulatus_cf.AAC.8
MLRGKPTTSGRIWWHRTRRTSSSATPALRRSSSVTSFPQAESSWIATSRTWGLPGAHASPAVLVRACLTRWRWQARHRRVWHSVAARLHIGVSDSRALHDHDAGVPELAAAQSKQSCSDAALLCQGPLTRAAVQERLRTPGQILRCSPIVSVVCPGWRNWRGQHIGSHWRRGG